VTTTTPDEPFYVALVEDDPEELYENAPCAYVSTLVDGTIVKVNDTLLAWTGYDRDDLVGRRRFQSLLATGGRIFYETHLAPALRLQGLVREIALELLTSDGRTLPVIVNSIVKRDATGAPEVVRTAMFDARERRAYETELLLARRRAEASEARVQALAATLQSTLLPPDELEIPGLDVAGVYRAAGHGCEVGGDFYDVFDTGHGTWGVVLGDVCGKGPAAAALTAVARYTVRAGAVRSGRPSEALCAAHTALLRHDRHRFCTAVFAIVEPDAAGAAVTVASAGHPLPLLVRPSGAIEAVGQAGTILGMIEEHRTVDVELSVSEGDRLVFYSDGVTEGRRGDEFFGEARLTDILAETAGLDAAATVLAVAEAVVDFQDGIARDDVAIVAIAVPPRDRDRDST
jgi:sigma-B regulation protein RsbU (phosphoserine phosphatase)